jgi:hypothetical protein
MTVSEKNMLVFLYVFVPWFLPERMSASSSATAQPPPPPPKYATGHDIRVTRLTMARIIMFLCLAACRSSQRVMDTDTDAPHLGLCLKGHVSEQPLPLTPVQTLRGYSVKLLEKGPSCLIPSQVCEPSQNACEKYLCQFNKKKNYSFSMLQKGACI